MTAKGKGEGRVRLTISVTPEVHETFSRLAKASGSSISWSMGEWLSDTIDASRYMTEVVEKARTAPAQAIQHVQGMLAEAESQAAGLLRDIGVRDAARHEPRTGGKGSKTPPSSNTGGKPPQTTKPRTPK